MLILTFEAGAQSYGIEAGTINRVLPMVAWRELTRPQNGIVAYLPYNGRLTPVLDFTLLITGERTKPRLSTRLLMLEMPQGNGPVALLVERATEVHRTEAEALPLVSSHVQGAAFLGGLIRLNKEFIQLIKPEALLTRQTAALIQAA